MDRPGREGVDQRPNPDFNTVNTGNFKHPSLPIHSNNDTGNGGTHAAAPIAAPGCALASRGFASNPYVLSLSNVNIVIAVGGVFGQR